MPLSFRRSILSWLSKSKLVAQIQYALKILLILVLILFVDSLNKIYSSQKHSDDGHTHDARTDTYLHAKMFYAQRNVYLTGSVIFLSLVLNRFYKMIMELLKNEEKMEV